MKIKFKLLLYLLFSAIISACSNEAWNAKTGPSANDENTGEVSVADIDPGSLNAEAKTYYELLKTAILATGSNQPPTRNAGSGGEGENPLVEKLEELSISDEDGNETSFFSLGEEEQQQFLEEWAVLEANDMTEKLKSAPGLVGYVKEQNEIVNQVLQEEAVQTRSGEYKVKDNKLFFAKIRERINAKAESESDEEEPDTRNIANIFQKPKVPFEIFKNALVNYAREGDFMLALPVHNTPWTYFSLTLPFMVGHSSVITQKVTSSSKEGNTFALGAWTKYGVTKEQILDWEVRSYIMGIRKAYFK